MDTVKIGDRLYEGKAKILYATQDPDLYVMKFKDSATAFDGKKKGIIEDKGACNARISAKLFEVLADEGVANHYVKLLSPTDMLVRRLTIIPIEVVVRNIAAGSISKRLGLEEGTPLKVPVVELYLKSDALGDPLINEYHVRALNLATDEEVGVLTNMALRSNEILSGFFADKRLILVDFKLEFGKRPDGSVILGDEISPDTCRLWDRDSKEKLDKDRFRRDLGSVEEAYREVLSRVIGEVD
ncbi:MAG TPA: phosphoribosylaminoimidazolesuccinocarboxamide synthase [Clostridia bacterium]|nr:phosphoribosylaminoimidazolesuccinocarboxamide synthase [Clostridia bacterium]